MAKEILEISCTPHAEPCESFGPNYNPVRARQECNAFMKQLRRMFGEEPPGARLTIRSNPHDFGTYLEVACVFNDENEEATDYAYRCESDMPEFWDAEAKAELGIVDNE